MNEKNIMNISNDGDLECYGPEYDAATDEIFDTLINNERLVIEQCTGLRDKNGKLIYEGDIVCYQSRGIFFVGAIMWKCADDCDHLTPGCFDVELIDEKFSFMDYSRDWRTFEVVGNIHDNPE